MKRILLATTLCCGLAMTAPARADLPVVDGVNLGQNAANFSKQIAQMLKDYQTLQSQLSTMTNMLNAIQHGNAVMTIARGLMNSTAQMPGSTSGAIPGMAFGAGIQGQHGQAFYDQNHVYTPTGTDFAAREMERKQEATANIQGELQTGMDVSDERVSMLNEMLYDIQNNDDPTYLAAAQAHIQSEQSFLANEQTKIARLQMVQAAQAQVDQQRAEQNTRMELEQMHAAAVSRAGW